MHYFLDKLAWKSTLIKISTSCQQIKLSISWFRRLEILSEFQTNFNGFSLIDIHQGPIHTNAFSKVQGIRFHRGENEVKYFHPH